MLIETGRGINTWVRDFFAEGHKSCNKLYDADGPSVEFRSSIGWARQYQQRAANREAEQYESLVNRPRGWSSYYELAEELKKMASGNRSGNCMEMAALTNYEAINTYNTSRSLCYICLITAPGDHAFALITEYPIMDGREMGHDSVTKFTKSRFAKTWLVIDPWLNTVCHADDYLQNGGQKLEQWAAKGKRVYWDHGAQGATFYAPGGANSEYKQKFAIAPVQIKPF